MVTKDNIKSIMSRATIANIEKFCDPLNEAMEKYGINTVQRQAMFLAQIAHESGELSLTRELWGPTEWQVLYERDFNHAWPPTKLDRRNESAYSLGNDTAGDGSKYRGHGLIQTTGRKNHALVSKEIGVDFIKNPELLEGPIYASLSAAWFWFSHNLNIVADSGDFDSVSDLINLGHKTARIGDSIGYAERLEFYEKAKNVFGL